MPKFIDKEQVPVKECIQWNHTQSVTLRKGMWVIRDSDGRTSYAEDEWFREHYEELR